MKKRISVIIPAYNEEKRIKATIIDIINVLKPYELIVVSEGTDKTKAVVDNLKNNKIKCFHQKKRIGKGAALKKGVLKSKGNIIIFADADLSADALQLKKLVKYIDKYDCIIGSREISGAKSSGPILRKILSMLFRNYVRLLFKIHVRDTQSGYKVFKKDPLMDIIPKVMNCGFEFDVELLWRFSKKRHTIKEIPIIWVHKKESKVNALFDGLKLFKRLAFLKIHN